MEDGLLRFVARFYEAGRLDAGRAFARFSMPQGFPSRRKMQSGIGRFTAELP